MIDYSNAHIQKVSVHHVGNSNNGEVLVLSELPLDLTDGGLKDLLMRYFLPPFALTEFYSFTFSNEDFNLNPLYNFASHIFDKKEKLHHFSIDVAKHLYEVSNHPQIKAGDLFVAYFSKIAVDNEVVDAIGIFKSENMQTFLKLNSDGNHFVLNQDDGINTDKLDKGCLVFDSGRDKGFKVCIVDKSSKSSEARFWKDQFLMLRPFFDEYHQTKDFLNIAQQYVTKQLGEEFEVNRTDQIDILNRSMEYFKSRDSFDKNEFEAEVFMDKDVIQSFRKFDETYREGHSIQLDDQFDISAQAVKKQARVFKSVLKLDKNFHIYIHGNRDLIEQGRDENGRKYYKIYFDKES